MSTALNTRRPALRSSINVAFFAALIVAGVVGAAVTATAGAVDEPTTVAYAGSLPTVVVVGKRLPAATPAVVAELPRVVVVFHRLPAAPMATAQASQATRLPGAAI